MPRVKLELPRQFSFIATIPVRITDVNYGGHVGNDTILSLIHEARMQYLQWLGYSELNFAGVGLIMGDVVIEFKQEAFYGNIIKAYVAAGDLARVSFDLYYKLTTEREGKEVLIAQAKTGMVCFDYNKKKTVSIPEEGMVKLKS